MRAIVRKEHPDWKLPDITKELAKLWRGLVPEEREMFNNRALSMRQVAV